MLFFAFVDFFFIISHHTAFYQFLFNSFNSPFFRFWYFFFYFFLSLLFIAGLRFLFLLMLYRIVFHFDVVAVSQSCYSFIVPSPSYISVFGKMCAVGILLAVRIKNGWWWMSVCLQKAFLHIHIFTFIDNKMSIQLQTHSQRICEKYVSFRLNLLLVL